MHVAPNQNRRKNGTEYGAIHFSFSRYRNSRERERVGVQCRTEQAKECQIILPSLHYHYSRGPTGRTRVMIAGAFQKERGPQDVERLFGDSD